MKLCRWRNEGGEIRVGLVVDDQAVLDLTAAGMDRLELLLESDHGKLAGLAQADLPRVPLSRLKLLAPIERQEVWAAGVTYLRSKKARMEESDFSASAYDRVYEAARPELFFKALPEKVVGPGEAVGIRKDARWNVPEPELALVISPRGEVVGYTIGNDMSSRDIEGENPLYLPQAKVYSRSCALGPGILLSAEPLPPTTKINLQINRAGAEVFSGSTDLSQLKRDPQTLVEYLYRDNTFPNGCFLLTGTGVVPPDSFTLQLADEIKISIDGIGTLINYVG